VVELPLSISAGFVEKMTTAALLISLVGKPRGVSVR